MWEAPFLHFVTVRKDARTPWLGQSETNIPAALGWNLWVLCCLRVPQGRWWGGLRSSWVFLLPLPETAHLGFA